MSNDNYALLKMVESAGKIRGRKKLQKLVYLLKAEDRWPFENGFIMHFFGPYSSSLAARVDDLTESGLLDENSNQFGNEVTEYQYSITDKGEEHLRELEKLNTEEEKLPGLIERFKQLDKCPVWQLELAATLVYWMRWGMNWDEALAATAEKKRTDTGNSDFQIAQKLANEVLRRE
jgi:uncharacterized protein